MLMTKLQSQSCAASWRRDPVTDTVQLSRMEIWYKALLVDWICFIENIYLRNNLDGRRAMKPAVLIGMHL